LVSPYKITRNLTKNEEEIKNFTKNNDEIKNFVILKNEPIFPLEEKKFESTARKNLIKSKCDYFNKNKENLLKNDK